MRLTIKNLKKTYPNGVKALDGIELSIGNGMFGLLGPNGAGKSSLMRTIATLQSPDEGEIWFDEINVLKQKTELRKVLGYLPQEFGVYPNLSAKQLLDYFARLKGVSSKQERTDLVAEILRVTNLYEVRNKNVSGYSGGMKQRFGIAQLLLNKPKLIIVDEPTAGLDPAERNRFLNVLREIGTNHTVIFSTHIVDDVKELCTDMAIMNGGRILQHQTPRQAVSDLQGKIWSKSIDRGQFEEFDKKYEVLSSSFNEDNEFFIRIVSAENPENGFISEKPQLEDVYFTALKNDR